MSIERKLYLYLIVFFIISCIQISFTGISYDESYYWMYSKFLSFGYFDHPPMVGWLIKIGELFGHGPFFTRLPFTILSVLSLLILWKLSEKKNLKIFILGSLSLPLLQASSFLALPDTPLLFFSVLTLYLTRKFEKQDTLINSFLVALSISLLFYSKYHGLLVVLLIVAAKPFLIKRFNFWLIIFLVIIFYAPHIYWQYQHDFVSFKFHLFGRKEKHFELSNIFNSLGTQIAVFGITVSYYLWPLKKQRFNLSRDLYFQIYFFILLIFIASFRNQIEGNWTITACAFYIPFLMSNIKSSKFMYLSLLPVLLIFVIRIVLLLPETFYENKNIGRLNEVKFWDNRIERINSFANGKKIISDTYQIASMVSYFNNQMIPALHIQSRNSHYDILKLHELIPFNEEVVFLSPKIIKGFESEKIETGYKDPVFMTKLPLNILTKMYKESNE